MVATWTGCFQPQHGDFGAQTSASEKDCDTQGNIDLDSRVVHWFSRVNGGIVWLGEGVEDCSPAQQLKNLQSLARLASKFLSIFPGRGSTAKLW